MSRSEGMRLRYRRIRRFISMEGTIPDVRSGSEQNKDTLTGGSFRTSCFCVDGWLESRVR